MEERRKLTDEEVNLTLRAVERAGKSIKRLNTQIKFLKLSIEELLPMNFDIQMDGKKAELAQCLQELKNEESTLLIYKEHLEQGVKQKYTEEE